MSSQLTLEVPSEVLRRAEHVATFTRRPVTDVLQEALALAFPALATEDELASPVEELSDREVLALCELRLLAASDARLSELLERRQAGEGDDAERAELGALMQSYEVRWLRQSAALAEAVRRGLRPPLEP
jgi:hypothetical protein